MRVSQLPLATRMLLDPQVKLGAAVLAEWEAACSAYGSDAAENSGAAGPSPVSVARRNSNNTGARRGAKRLIDTHDFLMLSEALDTLTGELKASTSRTASAQYLVDPSSPQNTIPACGTAAPVQCRIDDFDVRPDAMQSAVQQADVREACVAFRNGQYRVALDYLLLASSRCMPHELTSSLLHNIAVCYFKLEQWELCASTTQRVLSTDTAGAYRSQQLLLRVYICQGNAEKAQRLVAAHRGDATTWRDEAAAAKAFSAYTNFYATHQYARARESLETLLGLFPCGTLEATKARLLSLDNAGAAAQYARQKVLQYPFSAEIHLTAWELTFHAATSVSDLTALQDEMHHATVGSSELRFRLLQTHVARCSDAVNKLASLAQAKRWTDVIAYATQTLEQPFVSDSMKGIVYESRAAARVQLGTSWYEAMDDAHRALSYTEKSELRAQMLLLVARCEAALGRWQDAVEHVEESVALLRCPSTEAYLRQLRERRAQEQKKTSTSFARTQKQQQQQSMPGRRSKQDQQQPQKAKALLESHYKTLSLHSGADAAEVRKSYRAMAMKWHPDRWCGATAEEIHTAESHFKAIQDAYEKLMQSFT